ncbi:hypothetical protein N0V88_006083 [Collariella sp. IMI 366227]|nr:hypothetical protein N0V88_006083 [Collariella sp. IMI 366227]
MSSYYSTAYGTNIIISKAGGRHSGYAAGVSSSKPSTYSSPAPPSYAGSMDSSNASWSSSEAHYRSGSSSGHYVNVKNVSHPRGGPNTVVVHHNQPNPAKDEPKASEYYNSQYTSSRK